MSEKPSQGELTRGSLIQLLSAESLSQRLNENHRPVLLHSGSAENYAAGHLQGARHIDSAKLKRREGRAGGLVPDLHALNTLFRQAGVNTGDDIVVYDSTGGLDAARLAWILRYCSHRSVACLDGGLQAAGNAGLLIHTIAGPLAERGDFTGKFDPSVYADKSDVLASMDKANTIILDARSAEEYQGEQSGSDRFGHIPGAVSFDWRRSQAGNGNHILRNRDSLLGELAELGVTDDRNVIVYCQTHMRSSQSFVMLHSLGFGNVRGYAGSWSEWGNDPQLPIEVQS